MVNTAFVNYLDSLTESLKFPSLLNRMTDKQTLPISVQSFDFNPDVLKAPKTLKDIVHQFQHKKNFFYLQERYNNGFHLARKNSFFNNYTIDIFLFVTAIISFHRTTQVIKCSPWGSEVTPFPSLQKKMAEFLRHGQIIATPYANKAFQPRPKATATRKHKLETLTRPNREKLSQPRKVNVGPYPPATQRNWLATLKAK